MFLIIFLFGLMIALFFWLSHVNEDVNLRLLFFGVGFVFIPFTLGITLGIAKDNALSASIISLLEGVMIMMWILAVVVIFYCFIVIVSNFFKRLSDKNWKRSHGQS